MHSTVLCWADAPKGNWPWGNWQLSAAVEVLAETAAAEINAKLDDFVMTAGLTEILECFNKTLMGKKWHQEHSKRCSCCHQHFPLCVVYMLVKGTNIFLSHVKERFIQGVLLNKWEEINRGHTQMYEQGDGEELCTVFPLVWSPVCLPACLASVYPYLKAGIGVKWSHHWYSIKKSPQSQGLQTASPQACKLNSIFAMSHLCFIIDMLLEN